MASVDIAIPCYQYGHYLRECVASVLAQGIADLRILIIDNASTDNTLAIARELAAEDPRVEILARPINLGPHASFNAGVDWARSDYFMVLCADDLLAPGALARCMAVLEQRRDLAFAYGTDRHLAPGEAAPDLSAAAPPSWRIASGAGFIRHRCRNPEHYIAAGMVLVRTSLQKRAGHYRAELPHTDDLEMLLRLAHSGGVAATASVLGFKRMHGGNQTHKFLAQRTRDLAERLAAIESFFAHEGRTMPSAARLQRVARRSLAERAYWSAVKDRVRRRDSAAELFRFAFSLNPRIRYLPPFGYLLRMDRGLRDVLSGIRPERPAATHRGQATRCDAMPGIDP